MKKTTLLTTLLCGCITFTATSSFADEKGGKAEKKGGESHSHFTKIPDSVAEIWKEIDKQQAKLLAVVKLKDLGEAHDHAFAIRDLIKALPTRVAPDKKSRTEAHVKEITKIAADIDKSGAAGAQKATEKNVKKMEDAVKGLKSTLGVK